MTVYRTLQIKSAHRQPNMLFRMGGSALSRYQIVTRTSKYLRNSVTAEG